jgi:hypothetical protein
VCACSGRFLELLAFVNPRIESEAFDDSFSFILMEVAQIDTCAYAACHTWNSEQGV